MSSTSNCEAQNKNNSTRLAKLTDLLDTVQEGEDKYFLNPISTDGRVADYVADFQSSDIIDGWKHVRPKRWYHPLHQISSYLGRFPPTLARYFISKFSQENEVVYDPFSGSGTVPLEARLLNRNAIGNDIFIYAYTLTYAKVCSPSREQFNDFVTMLRTQTEARIHNINFEQEPLIDDLSPYYHKETLRQILAVRQVLNTQQYRGVEREIALFVKAVICGILHGDSQLFLSVQTKDTWSASPRYVREYVAAHGLVYEQRDVFENLDRKANLVYRLPMPENCGKVYRCNITRSKTSIRDNSIDLIVTSPPYLSVRNYPLDNWLRVWFLGSHKDLERQKMLITSNVKMYERGMRYALRQMYRVLKPNRACIIVAANVVRKVKDSSIYFTTQELAKIAKKIGFNVIVIFNDDVPLSRRTSQLFNTMRYDEMVDSVPRDSVLILSKGSCPIYPQNPIEYSVR